MTTTLIETVGKLSDAVDQFKSSYKDRLSTLEKRIDDRENAEAMADRPTLSGSRDSLTADQREHTKTFLDWVRKPSDSVRAHRLTENEHELARKDVSIGSTSAGGFALPEEISRAIEYRERQLNPFRQLVTVAQTSTNDYKALVSMSDGSTGWSSETGTRSATLSPTLRERAPTFGEQYAYPTASEWSLDDIFFDVQQWLVNEVAADWAAAEATSIISGNGSSRPTGILATTPVTTDDDASPVRAAGVIEYIPLTSASSPTSTTISIDSLIDLVSNVKEKYLVESDKVAFVMHRLTAAKLRKVKASTGGQYLWQENSQAGQPASLLGYKVLTCDAMPQATNDQFAVLFGNFARGYLLVDRVGIRVTPNPYSTPGQVSFYCRRRVGGCVLNNDAVKALRIAD